MTVNITAKKIQVTQAFSDYATKKIEAKLDRFFSGDADCKVTLSEQKNMITCEVTVRTAGLIFRSEQKAADKNDAFDACIDRIIRQIRKNKTRVEKQLHSSFKGGFDDVVEEQAGRTGGEDERGDTASAHLVEHVGDSAVAARNDHAVKLAHVCHGVLGFHAIADKAHHDLVAALCKGVRECEDFI